MWLLLVISILFSSVSFAQQKTIKINLDGVDIREFTKVVSKSVGKNFIVPENLKGKITIISSSPISKRELYNLYLAVLDELGFQVVDYGSFAKIVRKRNAPRETPDISKPSEKGEKVTTYIIVLSNLQTSQVGSLVRNLLSPIGRVSFVRDVNAIIITDKEKNIKRIEKILRKIDSSPVKLVLKSFELKNARARDVEKILSSLFRRTFALELTRHFPIPGREYFHFVVDDRTNTLFVVGTEGIIKRIEKILGKLDKPLELEKGYIHILKLNYAFAEDVEKVLKRLLSRNYRNRAGFSGKVEIVADKASNSLIVIASPNDFNLVKEIVSGIDIKRPQVFVEVQIVEMSMDKLLQMGVEWKFLARGKLVPFGGSLYGNLPIEEGYPSASPGLLLGLAKWRGNTPDIGLLINAYAKEGGVNVIATPQILTLDNEEAEINITQVIPYSTGVKYDANNNPVITYDYKDVGITLRITPHITASGEVRLKIYEKVEDVVGYANADQTAPITSKREAKTTVDVKDGQTLVIGGLIKSKKITTVEKVPILGNIPLFGNLFKKTGHQIEKTNLLVFITPRVVRTVEEENLLTRKKFEIYRKNVQNIQKSRKGIFSDIKGFGKFEIEDEDVLNVK